MAPSNDRLKRGARMANKLSDQLRKAIHDSELSRYRLAKMTAIDESALAKFCNGTRGLSLDAIDRLAAALKLRLTTSPRRAK